LHALREAMDILCSMRLVDGIMQFGREDAADSPLTASADLCPYVEFETEEESMRKSVGSAMFMLDRIRRVSLEIRKNGTLWIPQALIDCARSDPSLPREQDEARRKRALADYFREEVEAPEGPYLREWRKRCYLCPSFEAMARSSQTICQFLRAGKNVERVLDCMAAAPYTLCDWILFVPEFSKTPRQPTRVLSLLVDMLVAAAAGAAGAPLFERLCGCVGASLSCLEKFADKPAFEFDPLGACVRRVAESAAVRPEDKHAVAQRVLAGVVPARLFRPVPSTLLHGVARLPRYKEHVMFAVERNIVKMEDVVRFTYTVMQDAFIHSRGADMDMFFFLASVCGERWRPFVRDTVLALLHIPSAASVFFGPAARDDLARAMGPDWPTALLDTDMPLFFSRLVALVRDESCAGMVRFVLRMKPSSSRILMQSIQDLCQTNEETARMLVRLVEC
jgi:hypothetical protein